MPPIVTLLTDFGLRDGYVAEMKAVLLSRMPDVRIVDVTHLIPPQDVLAASVILERVVRAFPPGTVHVAVVDPGVGTARRLLRCRVNEQTLLLPDNGLITWTHRRLGPVEAAELVWRPADASATFHGRDVLAPAAAMEWTDGPPAHDPQPVDPVLLDWHPATNATDGRVLSVDHFGNAITTVPQELLAANDWRRVAVGDDPPVIIRRTYADAAAGEAVALVGSGGLLEIAVRDGHAGGTLGLRPGQRVTLS